LGAGYGRLAAGVTVALAVRQTLKHVLAAAVSPYDLGNGVAIVHTVSGTRPVRWAYHRALRGLSDDEIAHLRALQARPLTLESLAHLPEGTLGRVIHDWFLEDDLSFDYIEKAYAPMGEVLEDDWVVARFVRVHDFVHTIAGIQSSLPEEAFVQVFQFLNMGEPFSGLSTASLPWLATRYGHRCLHYGWHAATHARKIPNLLHVPWEEWLDVPLVEVRRRLGVPPAGFGRPRHLLGIRSLRVPNV
jgi:ubiquinone biosynthesis protein Coq4